MDNWQKLCEAVKTYTRHPKHCPFRQESCFEDHFSEYLRYIFGWNYDDVKRQYVVQAGHDNKRTDITLFNQQRAIIVFELKAFGQPLAGEEVKQFFSYMQLLPTKFGILTNSVSLQLYYRQLDEWGERSKPVRVLNLRFDSTSSDGKKLGELLTKTNYDENALCQFCDSILERKHNSYKFRLDNTNPTMSEQMDNYLDDKIINMIIPYKQWLTTNVEQVHYMGKYEDGIEWAKSKLLNIAHLKSITDKDFLTLLETARIKLPNLSIGGGGRTLTKYVKNNLHESKKRFISCISFLNSITETQAFSAINELLHNPSYAIKGIKRAFWAELIRCRFPEIPLVNNKTNDFFIALGINIGFTPEEQLINVYYCYNRWQELYRTIQKDEISIFELSHMEHFAKESEDGRQYMLKNFNSTVGEYI